MKNKTYPIIELVLLFLLLLGCGEDFSDFTSSNQSPTVLVPRKQSVPMDDICDLSLFGENLGDISATTNTGDIDGDGYIDLIVGSVSYDSDRGRAYLYYGGPNGLSSKPDAVFEGEPESRLGWSIGVGDVDNDGLDDIILSGEGYDSSRGRAYLYWGASRETMDTKAELVFEGENATDRLGFSWDDIICKDIDADGYDDIVIPAATYGPAEGRVYLYWGNTKTKMDSEADLIFSPIDGGGYYGIGLDCGDIDNDGYKDIVIGARTYGPNDCGRAYLYWGDTQENMDATVDLIFEAESTDHDEFGVNVGIGDVDNDSYEDILIGAHSFNNYQGRAYLYWGASKENMDTDCDLKFTGEKDRGGFAELSICDGDVNADGYADILITARRYDNFRGRAYIYLGDTKARMDAQAELVLSGENEGDWFGDPPGSSYGDFNNDGYDDMAIGAVFWQSNSRQGRVYVYNGGPTILSSDATTGEEYPAESLHRAASDGNIDLVKSLVSNGINVNTLDEVHRTPVHNAAMQGHYEVINFLISSGADIKVEDKWGYTPIDLLGTRNRDEISKLLVENGATIPTIHIAASVGDLIKVKAFVQEGVSLETRDTDGRMALHCAAQAGQTEVVEFLIGKGADINAKVNNGRTPLHFATRDGHKDIVELLIDKGADINAKLNNGRTPLHFATRDGHKDIVELLIDKGADINAKLNNGRTPLHIAVIRSHIDIVELLIAKGADLNIKNNAGQTPLDLAQQRGQTEIVELLKQHGAKE